MQTSSIQNTIIIHDDHVLLSYDSVIWSVTLSSFSEGMIVRKISLESTHVVVVMSFDVNAHPQLNGGQWVTVREALNAIDQREFNLLTKGVSLLKWDKDHQFCGGCARETSLTNQPFERRCLSCCVSYYPRISPAIIVLIYRDDHLLMARGPHFAPGVYALIAGFVEPGETLEEAVHREVFEEVGIKVKNLSYFGSQPWPFPDSLMIGFLAEYDSGDIIMDQNELEDAGWYRYDQLPGLPSFPVSISFKMIDHFRRLQLL